MRCFFDNGKTGLERGGCLGRRSLHWHGRLGKGQMTAICQCIEGVSPWNLTDGRTAFIGTAYLLACVFSRHTQLAWTANALKAYQRKVLH
ncbi:MAG: hypothetical protein CMH52_01555 [Myxococcales bacterium]|nr:hypothetical protein [Myxococcales bacterium]